MWNYRESRDRYYYGLLKDVLDLTLKATYDTDGHLKKLTISRNGKEEPLYIYYEDEEDAQKEIEKFAHENANNILDKIGMCKDHIFLIKQIILSFCVRSMIKQKVE